MLNLVVVVLGYESWGCNMYHLMDPDSCLLMGKVRLYLVIVDCGRLVLSVVYIRRTIQMLRQLVLIDYKGHWYVGVGWRR